MIFMPCGFYYFHKQYINVWGVMTLFQKMCWFVGLSMFLAMFLLNVYWYTLIIKGIQKICKKDANYKQGSGTNELHNM